MHTMMLTGFSHAQEVFMPTISIIPTDLLFQFKGLHFPIKLGLAMLINKSQGQTMQVLELSLIHI